MATNDPLGISSFLDPADKPAEQQATTFNVPAQWHGAIQRAGGDAFVSKVHQVSQRLGIDPNHLFNVMAAESALNPAIPNPSSNATGLIQFMPRTARGLGTDVNRLRSMPAIDQLDYVEKYLSPFRGRMKSQADVYGAVFLPRGLGKDVYAVKGTPEYDQNRGLDHGNKGFINAADLEHRARSKGGFGGPGGPVQPQTPGNDDPLGINEFVGPNKQPDAPPQLAGLDELAQTSQAVKAVSSPVTKPDTSVAGVTDKYLRIARGEAGPTDTPLIMPPAGGRGAGMARASIANEAEASGRPTVEAPGQLTGADAKWHYGMTDEELQNWKPTTRQLRVLQTAVSEDRRRKARGEEIGAPPIDYQNKMRTRAGLSTIANTDSFVSTKYKSPAPDAGFGGNPLIATGNARQQQRAEDAQQSRVHGIIAEEKNRTFMPGDQSVEERVNQRLKAEGMKPLDFDQATQMIGSRLSAKQRRKNDEYISVLESDMAPEDKQRAIYQRAQSISNREQAGLRANQPGVLNRVIRDLGVLSPVTAITAQLLGNGPADEPGIRAAAGGTGPALLGRLTDTAADLLHFVDKQGNNIDTLGGNIEGNKYVNSALGQFSALGNKLREGSAYLKGSADITPETGGEEFGKEFGSALGGIAQIIIMKKATGLPFWAIMGGEAALRTQDQSLTEQAKATTWGVATGLAYEYGPTVARRLLGKLPGAVGRLVKKMPATTEGLVSAGGFGTAAGVQRYREGATPGQAIAAGLGTAAGMAVLTGSEFTREAKELAPEVGKRIAASDLPEGLRSAGARVAGYEPVLAKREGSSEYASVFIDPKAEQTAAALNNAAKREYQRGNDESGDEFARKAREVRDEHIVRPLTTAESKGIGNRRVVEVPAADFDGMMTRAGYGAKGSELAGPAVAPESRQLETSAAPPESATSPDVPPTPTTAPGSLAVKTVADLNLTPEEQAQREAPAVAGRPETPRIPETASTIEAQMDALTNQRGSRRAVFIPPGQTVPDIPNGFKASETPTGTIIYPATMTRKQIRQAVNSPDENYKLLGHVNGESPQATRVVVARAGVDRGNVKAGDELMSSYVVPGNEAKAQTEMEAQFAPYQPQIEIGGAETEKGVAEQRNETSTETVTPATGKGLVEGSASGATSKARSRVGDIGLPIPTRNKSKGELETIVTAAIRGQDGQVVSGVNHPQILLSQGKKVPKDRSGPEYGFVTSTGRFVDRAEAAKIAGVKNTIAEGQLYTEDLTAVRKAAEARDAAATSSDTGPETSLAGNTPASNTGTGKTPKPWVDAKVGDLTGNETTGLREVVARGVKTKGEAERIATESGGIVSLDPVPGHKRGTKMQWAVIKPVASERSPVSPEVATAADVADSGDTEELPTTIPKRVAHKAFGRIVDQLPRDDINAVLDNWEEARLNPAGNGIEFVGHFRRNAFSGEGASFKGKRADFVHWLMSDAPFDPKVYGETIATDAEWRGQIERLREATGLVAPAAPEIAAETSDTITTPAKPTKKQQRLAKAAAPVPVVKAGATREIKSGKTLTKKQRRLQASAPPAPPPLLTKKPAGVKPWTMSEADYDAYHDSLMGHLRDFAPASDNPLHRALHKQEAAVFHAYKAGETVPAEVMARFPELKEALENPPEPAATPGRKEYQHIDFGHVVETEDQSGAGKGRIRVVDDQQQEHLIQRPKGTGSGNQKAIPVKGEPDAASERVAKVTSRPGTVHKLSSTQVDLPATIAKRILGEGQRLIPESEIYTDPNDSSFGREENPHVTLKYGLWTPTSADVAPLLKAEPPIALTLGKVSIFEAKEGSPFDVVKLEVESPDLHRLNKKISEGVDVTDTHPDYKPHATIAYVKPGEGKKYVGRSLDGVTGEPVTLNSVMFSGKDGDNSEIPLGVSERDVLTKSRAWRERLTTVAEARDVAGLQSLVDEMVAYRQDSGLTGNARLAKAIADVRTLLKTIRDGEPPATTAKVATSAEDDLSAIFDAELEAMGEPSPEPATVAADARITRAQTELTKVAAGEGFNGPTVEAGTLKTATKLISAIDAKDSAKLLEILHTGNKTSRRIFETETGVDLGKTNKTTRLAIENWASGRPTAIKAPTKKQRRTGSLVNAAPPGGWTDADRVPRVEKRAPEGIGGTGPSLIQFPSGKWGFVGRVPSRLGYIQKNGQDITGTQAHNIQSFGPGLVSEVQTRAWDTAEKALAEARRQGYEVQNAPATVAKPAGGVPAAQSLNDVAKGLAALFKGTPTEQSMALEASGFAQATYEQARPLFEAGIAHFEGKTAAESLRALMKELRESHGFEVAQIGAMKPYILRFVSDLSKAPESLASTAKEEDNLPDVDAQQTEVGGNGQTGAEGTAAGDLQATPGRKQTGRVRRPKSGISTGDARRIDESGAGSGGELERPDAADSEAINVEPPGRRDSDISGNRISYPSDAERDADTKHDYIAPVGSLTRAGSWRETARTNLDILELVKRLEAEGRLATPEEQALLVKFTGWGASEIANNLFVGANSYGHQLKPEWAKDGWRDLVERAKAIFTEDELETALRSTQYAHYTSEKIVRGVWEALTQFGFNGGSILEPGMGVGLFATAAPRDVFTKSRYTGIEMDKLTAAIAKQVLQRQGIIAGDFVKQKFPDNFFDIAIGNPPFSQTKITDDPKYKKYRFLLHDYFFAKSIDKVRPGGLLVFVTSKGTMDKGDDTMRKYIDERADLLGAIRLPQTAFKQNAGTEVVTDVLFFRKRMEGEEPSGQPWLGRGEIKGLNDDGKTLTGSVNEYFVAHPEMVLGQHSFTGSMRSADEYTVTPRQGDIEEHFRAAVQSLPTGVYSKIAHTEQIVKATAERDWNPSATKEGSLYVHADGSLRKVSYGSGVVLSEIERIGAKAEKWLRSYVGLRTALKQAQTDQLHDGDWETSLKELNKAYDAHVKKYGQIREFTEADYVKIDDDGIEHHRLTRRYKNNRLLAFDVEGPLVEALERITEDDHIVKSNMLERRTIKPPSEVTIRSLSDALAVSLDKLGTLNLAHVQELITPVRKMKREEIISELGDSVFEVPGGTWQMSDEYLSGFVIDKLEEAEAAARLDPKYARNVKALIAVQPKPLEPGNIEVGLGAAWIPPEVVNQFAQEELQMGRDVTAFDPLQNVWSVRGASGPGMKSNRTAAATWGTAARSPQEILDAALNQQTIKVYDYIEKKKVLNEADSAQANDVAKKMRAAFKSWMWTDAERTKTLVARYNRQFNNIAPRQFNGDHLTLPGLSAVYSLYQHQKRAVWRILQSGNTYLAHSVGAGKTLEMIVSGMEQRRLGLIRKPLYVVPGHMLKQFSSEFLDAYPLANILVADETNFAKENRKRFVAQAALNDLDAVVITHSAFGLIRTREETSRVVVDDMVSQLTQAISELDADDRNDQRTIKRLEQRIEAMERRFLGRTSDESRDNVVDFEDLGVDMLYVDEAHMFRKLDFITNHEQMKGVDPEGSKRSLDLLIKSRWLNSQKPGRSLVLASGTAITNTLAELYSIQRYMDPDELERAGLSHFDAWAAQFGEVKADFEMNAAGKYELVERFSQFVNIPELMKRVRQFMDVLSLRQLGDLVKLPTIKGGQPEVVIVPATAATLDYLRGELDQRIKDSRAWKPSFSEPFNPDPLINIITDGRLSAIDMRFVDRGAPNDPSSKLNVMIDSIIENYSKYDKEQFINPQTKEVDPLPGATQIVFSAVGFGEQVAINRGFDAKRWIIKRLTEEGKIPVDQIAFMSDYKLASAKERMFHEMRLGKVRVLIGSPQNMGTGVNVQKRLKLLHFLSPPWYPADVEQPQGRMVRQGNQNEEVEERRYATKGTYDSPAWQMIARKSRSIEQAMTGDDSVRKVGDLSESSQYEMASALAAGDERAIQLASLRQEVEGLERLKSGHRSEQYDLRHERGRAERGLEKDQTELVDLKAAVEAVGEYVPNDEFHVMAGAKKVEKRNEIGAAIKHAWIQALNKNKAQLLKNKKAMTVPLEITAQGKFPLTVRLSESPHGIVGTVYVKIAKVSKSLGDEWGGTADPGAVDAGGLAARLHNAMNHLSREETETENRIAQFTRQLRQIDSKLGQPFPGENDLYEKIAELHTLQREMAATDEADASAAADSDGEVPAMALDAGGEANAPPDFSVTGNRIILNQAGADLLAGALQRALGTVSGLHLDTVSARDGALAGITKVGADKPELKRYTDELHDLITRAWKDHGGVILALPKRLQHELGHELFKPLIHADDIPALAAEPGFSTARVKLLILGYPDDLPTLVHEVVAFYAEGRAGELGFSDEQGRAWIHKVIHAVMDRTQLTEEHVKELSHEIQRSVKEAIANRVHAETDAPEIDSSGQNVRSLPDGRRSGAGPPLGSRRGETKKQRRLREAAEPIAGQGDRSSQGNLSLEPEAPDAWQKLSALAGELEERPADQFAAGIKNAITDEELRAGNQKAINVEARRSIGTIFDTTRASFDPEAARGRMVHFAEKPRPLAAEETAEMIVLKTHLRNEYEKAANVLLDAQDKHDEPTELAARQSMAKISEDLLLYHEMARKTGYEQGLGLRLRAEMMLADYSLAAIMTRAMVANENQELPEHIRQLLEELTTQRDQAVEALKVYDEEAAQRAATAELRRLEREKKRAERGEHRTASRTVLDGEFAKLSQQFARAAARLSANPFFDPMLYGIIGRMARNRVQAGVGSVDELVDSIYEVVKDHVDEGTPRDLRDAISGYGKTERLSKDEITVQMGQIKKQMRDLSAVEDGITKGDTTPKTREARKRVRAAMREQGISEVATPEQHQERALKAMKDRIRDRISELRDQLSGTARSTEAKTPLATDEEARQLIAERDTLQAALDQLDARTPADKKPKTTTEKIKVATDAVRESLKQAPERQKRPLRTMLTDMEDAAKPIADPEDAALNALKTKLSNRRAKLIGQLESGNFEKKKKPFAPRLDEEALRLQAEVKKLERRIDTAIHGLAQAHKPAGEKALNYAVRLRRMGALSSSFVLGKLTVAAYMRIALSLAEELVGLPMPYLPIIGAVAKQAPREGYFSVRAEARALSAAFSRRMLQQSWQVAKGGVHDIDLVYGEKRDDEPAEMTEFFGHIHTALKTAPKLAEFARSQTKRLEAATRAGRDASDPVEVAIAGAGGLLDAYRAIFMQNNWVSDKFSQLARPDKSGTSKVASAILRLVFPVTRVAPNFVLESANYAAGSIPATLKLMYGAATYGLHDLPPELAESIIRGYKKQGIGFVFLALGIAAALGLIKSIEVGGYYQKGEKRKPDEVKAGRIRIMGHSIPSWATHVPAFELLQVGATLVRVSQAYRNKGEEDPWLAGGLAAGGGLASHVPFFEEPVRAAEMLEGSYEGKRKYAGDLLSGMIVPPDVQRAARVFDPATPTTPGQKAKELTGFADSTPVKRDTPTIGTIFQSKVPGLRNRLPVKSSVQMGAPRTEMTPALKEMDRLEVHPKTVRRYPDEPFASYHARAVAEGEAALQQLETTIQAPWYKALKTKTEKVKAIKSAINMGRRTARAKLKFVPPTAAKPEDDFESPE